MQCSPSIEPAYAMDEASSSCRHTDVQAFDSFHCCLSCGEIVAEATLPVFPEATCPNTPYYKYEPLDYNIGQQIRLVQVYPGRKEDRIMCEIVHADLANAPIYEALSYTWATASGDASLSQSLLCCGKQIAVTKNCEAAIRCLRWLGRSRILWIDAMYVHLVRLT